MWPPPKAEMEAQREKVLVKSRQRIHSRCQAPFRGEQKGLDAKPLNKTMEGPGRHLCGAQAWGLIRRNMGQWKGFTPGIDSS